MCIYIHTYVYIDIFLYGYTCIYTYIHAHCFAHIALSHCFTLDVLRSCAASEGGLRSRHATPEQGQRTTRGEKSALIPQKYGEKNAHIEIFAESYMGWLWTIGLERILVLREDVFEEEDLLADLTSMANNL